MPGVSFQSRELHVAHPTSIFTSVARLVCRMRPVFRLRHLLPTRSKSALVSPALPSEDGVGHPVKSLSDVRRPDAVCSQNNSPAGVAFRLQVCAYSIEPTLSNRARNLLANDSHRAALSNESAERGPEVTTVRMAELIAGAGEGLTGAGAGPDGPVVGPTGEAQREAPATDPCKKMALPEPFEVASSNISN